MRMKPEELADLTSILAVAETVSADTARRLLATIAALDAETIDRYHDDTLALHHHIYNLEAERDALKAERDSAYARGKEDGMREEWDAICAAIETARKAIREGE